jgi:hypothetical protein
MTGKARCAVYARFSNARVVVQLRHDCQDPEGGSRSCPKEEMQGADTGLLAPSTIREITKNELYRGVRYWNRTQKVLNPADGTKTKRAKPQSEWVRQEVPDLRIVADELWERVQEVNRRMKDKIYGRRLGGLNRPRHADGHS